MKVIIRKITSIEDAHLAIESTMREGFDAKCSLDQLYLWEHSPSRVQVFWVILEGVFSFVSTHFVRHSAVGQSHFVMSNREDRGGDKNANRWTPVNHRMFLNAQHLIDMSRVRLCYQASEETRRVMYDIRNAMLVVDPALAKYMVPFCVYQGGYCHQPKICGNYKVKRYDPDKILQEIIRNEND